MESAGEAVVFPLLKEWVDYTYRPCTIPYRFPSDPPHQPTPTEMLWIQLFRRSIPSFSKRAEMDDSVPDAAAKARVFASRFGKMLDDLEANPESHGGPPDCILLCRLREVCLRETGFRDIFKSVKDDENAKAFVLFEEVVKAADAVADDGGRLEHLVKCLLAGNVFDLGSAELAEMYKSDGMSFVKSVEKLLPRPWVIDDLDKFKLMWLRRSWKKAVIFVDNAGADIILGIIPLARELLRRGTQVVLAANELPSINDITYAELLQIMSKLKGEDGKIQGVDASGLMVINTGNDLPVIDLSSVSQELAFAAADADLVILEGMGRAIETNLYAQFRCDSLKVGMVKHQEVAEFLGGRLYDCVVRFTEVIA
ncbi:hypothetical protein SELMODRAFT_447908 [Selaginella moellendorffii]|uniref:Damage-control phosphatase ARMT1-like metal-binding domain-containing protein n=1 Tax=Selaginella moellendorffii TaxID=88036 RepID=D8T3E1_SELML|nr:uncharacterized protein At2g17340 [Selaginella moellendorffii]EFJ08842.1 hypothetical protein SELMODRAFT_447908 [Selaginella moellendorffii]|eukprot:XP_024519622.1 uncharacterized protein At2g17340 [Selaginella moellendorffii]